MSRTRKCDAAANDGTDDDAGGDAINMCVPCFAGDTQKGFEDADPNANVKKYMAWSADSLCVEQVNKIV